ncbi:hypothetical protein [Clostridium estertheticum]|nr:hypothetical protein [Clostridium estertheticum]
MDNKIRDIMLKSIFKPSLVIGSIVLLGPINMLTIVSAVYYN